MCIYLTLRTLPLISLNIKILSYSNPCWHENKEMSNELLIHCLFTSTQVRRQANMLFCGLGKLISRLFNVVQARWELKQRGPAVLHLSFFLKGIILGQGHMHTCKHAHTHTHTHTLHRSTAVALIPSAWFMERYWETHLTTWSGCVCVCVFVCVCVCVHFSHSLRSHTGV